MKDGLSHDLTSPEEHGEGTRPPRGGSSKRHEGGFAEGDYGRGPTPYNISHSAAKNGLPMHKHLATSGRGGGGIIGKGDGFKGRSEDIEHPQSHADFERLGADGPTEAGGED